MTIKIVINQCYGGFGLSNAAKAWLKERGFDADLIYPVPRDLPLLVECVETLGSEAASSSCAELKVCEFTVSWNIKNYDGIESISGYLEEE